FFARGQVGPEFFARGLRIGQDHAKNFSAANQTIVPAEVVVEQQIKGFRLAGAQGLDGALLNFRLQTAAAESPLDAAIAIKKSLRANFLRAGTFNVDDDSQRD